MTQLDQFLMLLTGARDTGKSWLIKACLNCYAAQGLRLISSRKRSYHPAPH